MTTSMRAPLLVLMALTVTLASAYTPPPRPVDYPYYPPQPAYPPPPNNSPQAGYPPRPSSPPQTNYPPQPQPQGLYQQRQTGWSYMEALLQRLGIYGGNYKGDGNEEQPQPTYGQNGAAETVWDYVNGYNPPGPDADSSDEDPFYYAPTPSAPYRPPPTPYWPHPTPYRPPPTPTAYRPPPTPTPYSPPPTPTPYRPPPTPTPYRPPPPTTTYPPPTTTTPLPNVPNLCYNCTFRHGLGYNAHPSDCTLYVQCRANDHNEPVVAAVMPCPHGLYWNQHKLTCDYRHNVNCVDDICLSNKRTKPSASSCRGFWDCSSGYAEAKCCAKGLAYNDATGYCQPQNNCKDDCLDYQPYKDYDCPADLRPIAYDRTHYEQLVNGVWLKRPCAPGTAFSTYPCGCSIIVAAPHDKVCLPELQLSFNDGVQDESGKHTYVENDGVLVKDGKAYFSGKSKLIIPRFSNSWWGSSVYIYFRFKPFAAGNNKKQALVSNSDCFSDPSLSVCADHKDVEFFADTEYGYAAANFTVPYSSPNPDGFNDVLFKLDDDKLEGFVNFQKGEAVAKGNLETRHYGLVIGMGTGCDNFDGFIDEVFVYLCKPSY